MQSETRLPLQHDDLDLPNLDKTSFDGFLQTASGFRVHACEALLLVDFRLFDGGAEAGKGLKEEGLGDS